MNMERVTTWRHGLKVCACANTHYKRSIDMHLWHERRVIRRIRSFEIGRPVTHEAIPHHAYKGVYLTRCGKPIPAGDDKHRPDQKPELTIDCPGCNEHIKRVW